MEELKWIREAAEEIRKRRAEISEEEIVRRVEDGEVDALKKVIVEAARCGDQKKADLWMKKFYELFARKISESDGIGAYEMVYTYGPNVADYREKRESMQQQVVTLLEKQLKDGKEEARPYLNHCYCRDISNERRSIDDAIGLWQEFAESGDAKAEWNLSSIYASFTENEDVAHEWLERSARHGLATAQYAMAEGYITLDEETSEYVGKEAKKAIPWLKMAAERNDEPMGQSAMLFLGDVYQFGCKEGGIRVDYKKAIFWYKLAAQYGEGFDKKEALIKLARCYKNSRGANRDANKAFKMFEAIAKIGGSDLSYSYDLELIASANMGLAVCYYEGIGVEKNVGKAIAIWEEYAEKSDETAYRNLGREYGTGKYLKRDYEKAFYWTQKAAELGDVPAIVNLGWCYEKGYGTEKDVRKAVEYYKKAVNRGNRVAKNNLKRLKKKGIIAEDENN